MKRPLSLIAIALAMLLPLAAAQARTSVAEAFFVNPEQAWMAPFAASLLPADPRAGVQHPVAS